MPIPVTCPECKTTDRVADAVAGKAIKCRQCGARVAVPAADDDSTALKAGGPERRAARPRDDDDDDGRREAAPKRKGGSGTVIAIVAGIVLGACCICGGIGGGIYWAVAYTVNKGKDALVQIDKKFQEQMDKQRKEIVNGQKEIAKDKGAMVGGNVILERRDRLMKNDPRFNDPTQGEQKPSKTYRVKLEAGKQYVIDMKHRLDGDPYLVLLDPKDKEVARDDDSGGFLNAQIRYRPTVTGEYTIHATSRSEFSYGQAGMGFVLTVKQE